MSVSLQKPAYVGTSHVSSSLNPPTRTASPTPKDIAQITSLLQRRVKNEFILKDADAKISELQKLRSSQEQQLASQEQKLAADQQKLAADQQKLAADQQKLANLEKQRAENRKNLFVKAFCSTLGLKIPQLTDVEEINRISSKYFSDKDFSIDPKLTLNSMKPFVDYLKEHPEVKQCNFSGYKAVHDVATLAKFLVDSKHPVKAIGFDASLKNSIEESFNKVLGKENHNFKILFLESKKPAAIPT